MAKTRVYELAKELGVDSKYLLQRLREAGEFARSASSTLEPPVVRRIRQEIAAKPPLRSDARLVAGNPFSESPQPDRRRDSESWEASRVRPPVLSGNRMLRISL